MRAVRPAAASHRRPSLLAQHLRSAAAALARRPVAAQAVGAAAAGGGRPRVPGGRPRHQAGDGAGAVGGAPDGRSASRGCAPPPLAARAGGPTLPVHAVPCRWRVPRCSLHAASSMCCAWRASQRAPVACRTPCKWRTPVLRCHTPARRCGRRCAACSRCWPPRTPAAHCSTSRST